MPRRKISHGIVAASIALFGLPLSAYAVVENSQSTASQTPPSVIIFNQKPKANQVNVTYAYLPSAGHLVIYGSHDGKPGTNVIGSAKLDAGDHRNFAVKLDKSLPSGTSVWASLTNSDKQSFWKKGSVPLQNEFMIE